MRAKIDFYKTVLICKSMNHGLAHADWDELFMIIFFGLTFLLFSGIPFATKISCRCIFAGWTQILTLHSLFIGTLVFVCKKHVSFAYFQVKHRHWVGPQLWHQRPPCVDWNPFRTGCHWQNERCAIWERNTSLLYRVIWDDWDFNIGIKMSIGRCMWFVIYCAHFRGFSHSLLVMHLTKCFLP